MIVIVIVILNIIHLKYVVCNYSLGSHNCVLGFLRVPLGQRGNFSLAVVLATHSFVFYLYMFHLDIFLT
jgi:hypothetical protein